MGNDCENAPSLPRGVQLGQIIQDVPGAVNYEKVRLDFLLVSFDHLRKVLGEAGADIGPDAPLTAFAPTVDEARCHSRVCLDRYLLDEAQRPFARLRHVRQDQDIEGPSLLDRRTT